MKILFHNYSNETTTEPAYLCAALQKSGVDAKLWSDPRMSAFDAFDLTQPDVFVTSYQTITPDILKYIELNNKKIDLVLNVTGVSDAQMEDIESVIKNLKINVPLVFINSFSYKRRPKTSLKCERLFPAFDLFNIRRTGEKALCEEAVLATKPSEKLTEVLSKKRVYHLVQITNGKKDEEFDIRANAPSMQDLFKYYRKWSLVGDADFCSSQIFFDLNFNVHNIVVAAEDGENFDKFLEEIFEDKDSGEDIGVQIKNQLKLRHTPFHRAATLMKYLKFKDGMSQVEHVKTQLSDMLKGL
jgi:hypothetical protein